LPGCAPDGPAARPFHFADNIEASELTSDPLALVDGGRMAAKFGTWDEERADFREGRWRLR